MMLGKVRNMKSPNGNDVPNQFIITQKGGILGNFVSREIFQSYDSIIAVITRWGENNGYKVEVELDENTWDYSVTTGKYRNMFLGENKKETEAKIKSGEYKLADLNK